MAHSNNRRSDRQGAGRLAFEEAKKVLYATETVCYLCGKPLDFSIKPPHPLSVTVDHVIPLNGNMDNIELNGIDNLHLAHRCCNRAKGTKLLKEKQHKQQEFISNRVLPQHNDWATYRAK